MVSKALDAKKESVKKLKDCIDKAKIAVIADYKGFNVKEMTDLRKLLYKEDAEYKIVKNTVLSRAVDSAYPDLQKHMQGTTAILLGYKDAVAPLKIMVDFLKEIEKGAVRAGVIENAFVGQEDLIKISKLPGRDVLLAKLVGSMKSPMSGLVNVMQGTIRSLVYALNAYKEKKGVN